MKALRGSRRHQYLVRGVIFLLMVALITGMAGCGAESPENLYDLTVSSTEGGVVTSPGEDTFSYDEGTVVNLVAQSEEGYRFVNWTGAVGTIASTSAAATTITMNSNYSIIANFEVIPEQYNLTISSTVGGNVTGPGEGTYDYDEGKTVNLVATANDGYEFDKWTGDVSSIANPEAAQTTITMNNHYSITAGFSPIQPPVVVAVLGDYESKMTELLVDHDIAAEERDWDVVDDLSDYDVVVINRPSDPEQDDFLKFLDVAGDHLVGIVFTSSWQVDEAWGVCLLERHLNDPEEQADDSRQGNVYYNITAPHPIFEDWEVGANITIIDNGERDHSWFLNYTGDTIAEVGSEEKGLQGDGLAVSMYGGSVHVLLASLGIQEWTNTDHWTEDARTVFVNSVIYAKTLRHTLTIDSTEGGSVIEPGEGEFAYEEGTPVHLVALAEEGYAFTEWTGNVEEIDDAEAPGTTITMNGDYKIIANFEVVTDQYELTISSTEGGSVTEPGEGPFTYDDGEEVDLIAEPAEGYRFHKWTGDVDQIDDANAAETTVTMNGHYVITATFSPLPFVAVLGDYESQMTDLLKDHDMVAEARDWDVVDDLADYDAVVINRPSDPGQGDFLDFLNAASTNEVGVVFASGWSVDLSWGISLLEWYLDDALGGQADASRHGNVYYNVTAPHPVFERWELGDTITIIDKEACDHAWFSGYTGTTIAEVGSEEKGLQGDGLAVSMYGESVHVLLASLGVQEWTNIDHWTEDARTIFVNAVSFAVLPRYHLTISSNEGGGVIEPGEGTFTYDDGTVVDLVAEPAEGYRFDKWTGDVDQIDDVNAAETTITIVDGFDGLCVKAEFSRLPLWVAVLGDFESQLTDLLQDDSEIWAEERDWGVVDDLSDYDVVVINRPPDPGKAAFLAFLDAASDSEVGMVFTSNWSVIWSWGISLLEWHLDDPEEQDRAYEQGDVYYQVVEAHPIFEGWGVGDTINIIEEGDRDHAWFWGYTGDTIAKVGSADGGVKGSGVAVSSYGESMHVLLASLGPQSFANVEEHWTTDAGTIFINAVAFAARLENNPATHLVTMDDDNILAADTMMYGGNSMTGSLAATSDYTLTISSTNGGTVTDPGEDSFTYEQGKVVRLTAQADEGYAFIGWTGDTATIDDVDAAETTIRMQGDYSIVANFDSEGVTDYTLTVSSTNGGTVTDPGEDSFTYEQGKVVRLTAQADNGYRFVGWTGDVDQIDDTQARETVIIMLGNYSITAGFEAISDPSDPPDHPADTDRPDPPRHQPPPPPPVFPVQYEITASSTAGGVITRPGERTLSYYAETVVNLVAEPHEGYHFVNWTGDVGTIANVNSATTTIRMRGDYSIKANFAIDRYDLTISSTEGGSVITPDEGSLRYDTGTVVDLVAVAEEGYRFVGWTGDVNEIVNVDASETSVTILGDYSIRAGFEPEPRFPWSVLLFGLAIGGLPVCFLWWRTRKM